MEDKNKNLRLYSWVFLYYKLEKLTIRAIINIGEIRYFILSSNERKEGLCMSKMNEKLRKKLVGLGISVVVIALVLAVLAVVPVFKSARTEIKDNQLTIVRENLHHKSVDVVVNMIDDKGNVEKVTVKINLEGDETNYTFDQEYFKRVLDTEDNVYIVEIEEDLFNSFSNYTPWVSVVCAILFIIAMIACWFFMMCVFSFIH